MENEFKEQMQLDHDNQWVKYPPHYWDCITNQLNSVTYKKNSIIYHQGDLLHLVYIVKSGRVRLSYYNPDGDETGIFIAEENCLFGEAAALPEYITCYTATAIVDTELFLLPTSMMISEIKKNPDFSMKIINSMARKIRIYSSQEVQLSGSEAYLRTCHTLLHIAEVYGISVPEGIKINMKFTHQELANMVHTSRVSIANIFRELTQKKIISKKDGYYIILNYKALIHDKY